MASSSLLDLFLSIGLERGYAESTLKSDDASSKLKQVIHEAGLAESGCDKGIGNLLNNLATTLKKPSPHRGVVSLLIAQRKLKTVPQVSAAVAFLTKLGDKPLDEAALHKATGVGVETSPAEIKSTVKRVIADHATTLQSERYSAVGKLKGLVAKELPWADGKLMTEEFDAQVLSLIGPKTDEDSAPKAKKPAKVASKDEAKSAPPPEAVGAPASNPASVIDEIELQGRDLPEAHNTPEQLERHRLAIGDCPMLTRFPPEPNGFLHLGHAKAMAFNFGEAKRRGGKTYLRFDDTNPTEEKQLYIDKIIECVHWLGHQPFKITYSSAYFPELYQLGIKLIERGFAYVCHQTQAEIEATRESKQESPWRNRPIEENLRLFKQMKYGLFDEGSATLRMKGDVRSSNPNMWDLVAYRIKFAPHPHAGRRWCIYPSYDFTHCIIDSLENITHSLCTLEFESRREPYYWLLDKLDLYKPNVWEYSRLNLEYNVMSKRKLKQLVEEHYVKDWDDPRLLTLMGLKRRGVTPECINAFVARVGVSRNFNVVRKELFDFCVRDQLNPVVPRAMVVCDPVKLTVTNWPADKPAVEIVRAPVSPLQPDRGAREIPFSRVLYIDREDFRTEDEPGYFRLAPKKTVHLMYAYNITCTDFKVDASGKVSEILATVDWATSDAALKSGDKARKVKGNLHWVAEPAGGKPLEVELRLYDTLFTVPEPPKDWLSTLNPKSLVVVTGLAEPGLATSKPEDKFQFERVGFFCTDLDSRPDHLVFNLTVTLRDTKGKDDS